MAIEDVLASLEDQRDAEEVPVMRKDLRNMLQQTYIYRDGMKVEQARIHAEAKINEYMAWRIEN